MMIKLLLGLLLTANLTAAAAQPTEDPCALARRIAQSPPCLAGSACEAVDLWREAFGVPDVFPVRAGELPPELASRLPGSEVTLEGVESYEAAFRRLGEASGVEVILHPGIKGKRIVGPLGSMPVEKAWKVLLGTGDLVARFDGERVRVAELSSGPKRPHRSSTRNCLVR